MKKLLLILILAVTGTPDYSLQFETERLPQEEGRPSFRRIALTNSKTLRDLVTSVFFNAGPITTKEIRRGYWALPDSEKNSKIPWKTAFLNIQGSPLRKAIIAKTINEEGIELSADVLFKTVFCQAQSDPWESRSFLVQQTNCREGYQCLHRLLTNTISNPKEREELIGKLYLYVDHSQYLSGPPRRSNMDCYVRQEDLREKALSSESFNFKQTRRGILNRISLAQEAEADLIEQVFQEERVDWIIEKGSMAEKILQLMCNRKIVYIDANE